MAHPEKKSLIYGRHPVIDAIESGTPFDKLMLQKGIHGDFERSIRHLSKAFNIPLQVVPKERLNKFVKGNHQGIVGWLSVLRYYRLEDVLPLVYERSETPLFLLLDGVTDVRNFGAIARSAEICGVHAIIIPKKGSAQINEEAMKTSAGALSKIHVCRETSIKAAIEWLQLSGIRVVATDLQAATPIQESNFVDPLAIVLGSEGDGVSAPILRAVDEKVIIPQVGTTNSFNVSVSAGILLYEVLRQRLAVG